MKNNIPHDAAICYKLILKDHFIHIVIEAPHLKLTVLNIYHDVIILFYFHATKSIA